MENASYRPRIIDPVIENYLKSFGGVWISGPKWCGKTWTSAHQANSAIYLDDSRNNFQARMLAEISPDIAIQGEPPRLIDEWQDVPKIWDAVRHEIDKRGKKGQFILTGSATLLRNDEERPKHSGAGRIARIRMRPMSLFESGDSSGEVSLKELMEGKVKASMTGDVGLERLAGFIVNGGWPEGGSRLVADEYIKALLESDMFKVDKVHRDSHRMSLLLRSLARNESTTCTTRKIWQDISENDHQSMSLDTVVDYLSVLDHLYVTENIPPFSDKIRSPIRVKQAGKRHFPDPSLPASLLRVTEKKLIDDLKTFGFLFESLCLRDLLTYASAFGGEVYHYQDYRNNEIDAVVEMEDGSWGAFEIKLGANQIDKAAENLLKIKSMFEREEGFTPPKVLCVICGLSIAAYQREDGVFVIPLTALKD